jgi:hypothetical protein
MRVNQMAYKSIVKSLFWQNITVKVVVPVPEYRKYTPSINDGW